MKNKEKFKDILADIACTGRTVAIRKNTLIPEVCNGTRINCDECLCCDTAARCNKEVLQKWAEEEYEEPCEFEPGELVEVSYDGVRWALRYFAYKDHNHFYTSNINSGPATDFWKYCQKYGTLGGLINGDGSPTGNISEEGEGYVR